MSEYRTDLQHARAQWHEANTAIGDASGHGNPPDPHRYAALLDARAGWWDHLGQLADRVAVGDARDVYAIACSYAAILDRTDAAGVRFRYRIPTLHPSGVAQLVGLNDNRCEACGRPWLLDAAGACPRCPALVYGITPGNAHEASTYPPGRPWTPEHTLGQEDVSTARHERVMRGEPLTETEWNALRELAWSPAFEPPAGIPERYRHDALRLALGEAERLAGRARSNRDTAAELTEILAKHRVMVAVNGRRQTPKLYTDLLEWDALNIERETYHLREKDADPLPDKIPARVKADASDNSDGQVFLVQRPIPAQLDYYAEKLASHLDEKIPRDTFRTITAAVVGLSAIAHQQRVQTAEQDQQQRDHAEAIELLGHLVDHHGYCQEHNLSQPCDVSAARALLARIRGEQTPGDGEENIDG